MSAKRKSKTVLPGQVQSSQPQSADILAVVTAEGRMMTREERVAFIDSIRSNFKGPVEDSTPLIRRDRDER